MIDTLYGKRDRLAVESSQSLLSRISLLMQQAFSMFDVLALVAILVGLFGIANTLTMNVIERTQEIGMLRGVGMTRFQVVGMILAEAASIGLVGGILGVVLGVILAMYFLGRHDGNVWVPNGLFTPHIKSDFGNCCRFASLANRRFVPSFCAAERASWKPSITSRTLDPYP